MADFPELDFKSWVDARRSSHLGGGPETEGHAYAYNLDQSTRAAFARMTAVELAVTSSVRMFKQVWRSELLGNAVKVSDRQFPRLQRIARECADTLHIPTPQLYIVANSSLNAATYGTHDESFIMVHSALIDHYTDEELRMVIGHECGHIHNKHVVYLTALHYLTQMAGIFVKWAVQPALLALNAWSRRAEITCDRAGMLCSRDLDVSTKAMTKLVLGSRKLYEEFNMDAFLEQYEEGKDGVGKYMEVFASHPWLPKRVLAMRVFAESALYREAAKLGPGGLTMAEVDEKVRLLLKGDA